MRAPVCAAAMATTNPALPNTSGPSKAWAVDVGPQRPRSIGTSISPAPCRSATVKDHNATCRGRMRESHRGWRGYSSRSPAKPMMPKPAAILISRPQSRTSVKAANGRSTTAIETRWPTASGARVRATARPSRSVRPAATASGQPIPGFNPWYTPLARTAAHSATWASIEVARRRVAERICRAVATLKPNLVSGVPFWELHMEVSGQLNTPVRTRVAHRLGAGHPARIELWVPGRIERVGEIHTLPVAADLDHLRPACERLAVRVRRALRDAANAHRTGERRLAWV